MAARCGLEIFCHRLNRHRVDGDLGLAAPGEHLPTNSSGNPTTQDPLVDAALVMFMYLDCANGNSGVPGTYHSVNHRGDF